MRKAVAAVAGLAAVAAALVPLLQTFTAEAADVRIAVEFNDHSAAFWVALDRGYFREEGVRVSYKVFSTGLELSAAMRSGDADMAIACLGPILVMVDRGYDVVLVEMLHNHGYSLVARPGIGSVEGLRGATVSATGPGSPTWLLLHLVMDRYGLNATVKRMKPQIAVNALVAGEIDAAVLPEHYATLAVKEGAVRLLTSQDIWPDWPGSGLAVTADFMRQHPDIVQKVAAALRKATRFINEHPREAAAIVAKHLGSDEATMMESMSYLTYTNEVVPEEVQKYIDYLAHYGALTHELNATEFVAGG